jgi:hypothetical protein
LLLNGRALEEEEEEKEASKEVVRAAMLLLNAGALEVGRGASRCVGRGGGRKLSSYRYQLRRRGDEDEASRGRAAAVECLRFELWRSAEVVVSVEVTDASVEVTAGSEVEEDS